MDPTDPAETQPSSSHASSSSLHGRFEPGARLGTRYRVVGLLGRGGMGEVYRADDLELNQSVALKFLPERVARSDADLARLRQEVRIARQIAHPNVCRTYDIAEADGQVFLVMEYVDGEDLASVLRRLGRPTTDKAVEIARQLCLGLGAAHENGVLHRDLKPANIMIDGRGRVRITDFGLAVTAGEHGGGGIAGTPAYMAPEQLRSGAATAQTDIFSLGLVLYEIFTGKRAADMTLPPDPARPGSDSSVRTPSSLVGEIDPAVERVILRCLERDPARRPQSAYAVYGALPGGDPLAAAVAAGETPSPELVANAGVEGSVRPLWAGIAAAFVFLGFIAVMGMSRPAYEGFGLPPRALSARADEVLTAITGKAPPRYTGEGLRYAPLPSDTAARAGSSGAARPTAMKPSKQYWRRWSPEPLLPTDMHAARVHVTSPPQGIPGSATAVLDMAGRLVALSIVPQERGDTTASSSAREPADTTSSSSVSAWAHVLRAARGGAGSSVAPVAASVPRDFVPYADSAAAWQLAGDTTLAAAALGGMIVRVDTFAGNHALGSLVPEPGTQPETVLAWLALLVLVLFPLLGSIVLARGNVRAARIDLRGAFLVGASVFVIYMVLHLLTSNLGELGLYRVLWRLADEQPIGHALLHSVEMALFYLAIEPYVRRLWPSVLVSWARLVARRPRDPIIGRDVLAGAVAGTLVVLVSVIGDRVARSLGLTTKPLMIPDAALDAMTSTSVVIAAVCYALATALLVATSIFMLLVLLRFLLRNNLAAAALVVALATFALADFSSRSVTVDLLVQALSFSLIVGAALRFGYLAAIIAVFVWNWRSGLIWTGEFQSWIAPTAMFSWAVLAIVLAYGFLTAVKGRTLFRDPLSDPVAAPQRRG